MALKDWISSFPLTRNRKDYSQRIMAAVYYLLDAVITGKVIYKYAGTHRKKNIKVFHTDRRKSYYSRDTATEVIVRASVLVSAVRERIC